MSSVGSAQHGSSWCSSGSGSVAANTGTEILTYQHSRCVHVTLEAAPGPRPLCITSVLQFRTRSISTWRFEVTRRKVPETRSVVPPMVTPDDRMVSRWTQKTCKLQSSRSTASVCDREGHNLSYVRDTYYIHSIASPRCPQSGATTRLALATCGYSLQLPSLHYSLPRAPALAVIGP